MNKTRRPKWWAQRQASTRKNQMHGQDFNMQSRNRKRMILMEMKNHKELNLKLAEDLINRLRNMLKNTIVSFFSN
jgi:hypothetical protein